MLAIVPSWADAKVGAGVNGIVAIGLVFGFLSQGPWSLRAEYEADVERHVPDATAASPVTEADLAHLPRPGAEISPRGGRRRTTARVKFSRPDARSHP